MDKGLFRKKIKIINEPKKALPLSTVSTGNAFKVSNTLSLCFFELDFCSINGSTNFVFNRNG